MVRGVLVLAGPPAVGHNTVAELLAERAGPAAVVDGDDLRAMIRPPTAPGSGAEWDRQNEVAIRNLCAVATNLDAAGYGAIVVDVAEPQTVPRFRELLAGVSRLDVVLLTADDDTLVARDRARHPAVEDDPAPLAAWHQRIRSLRARLDARADLYDHRLDSTGQTPEQTVDAVLDLLLRRARDDHG